jgi:hypothetical protein
MTKRWGMATVEPVRVEALVIITFEFSDCDNPGFGGDEVTETIGAVVAQQCP